MAYTLAEARTRARTDYLDDPDGDRWPNAEMDRHLKYARDRVLDWYVLKGFQGFRDVTEVSVAAGTGYVDMSSIDPRKVMRVLRKNGDFYQALQYVARRDRPIATTEGGTFAVFYDSTPAFPASDGLALIDSPSSNASLEELVVLRACESALIKDYEVPRHLLSTMQRLEKDVLNNMGVRRSEPFMRAQGHAALQWSYDYANQRVVLSRAH
jgi:hypothetical protein